MDPFKNSYKDKAKSVLLLMNFQKAQNLGLFTKNEILSAKNMDTFNSSKSQNKTSKTLKNLYQNNGVYYFRFRVKTKLYRKSLKTSNLKEALLRVKLIKSMKKEELINMFELKDKDYSVLFEYDTIEELEALVTFAKEMKRKEKEFEREKETPLPIPMPLIRESYTFSHLEKDYLAYQNKLEKVSRGSFVAYNSAFSKLKRFFGSDELFDLNIDKIEAFRDFLIHNLKLENKTSNNIIIYVKQFLDFAKQRGKIKENPATGVKLLKEVQKETKNYTDFEVVEMIKCAHQSKMKYAFPIFMIATHTGLRINEILTLQEENLKSEDGIPYIQLFDSKSKSGIRKIPLHPILQENFSFEAIFKISKEIKDIEEKFKDLEKNKIELKVDNEINYYSKDMISIVYKVIEKGHKQTFHTLRGTFAQKLINIDSKEPLLIQEIIGHSKGNKSLTYDTYAKEFYLSKKLDLIKQVRYEGFPYKN